MGCKEFLCGLFSRREDAGARLAVQVRIRDARLTTRRRSGLVDSGLRFATWKNDASAACAHDGVGGSGDHHASDQSVG